MNLSRLFTRSPPVYLMFIVINIGLFVFQLTRGVSAFEPTTSDMIDWGANVAALTLTGEPWRLLTSMFLHVGLVHILFNMYMLLVFGIMVEERFGSTRFALVYMLSGLFGSLLSATYHGTQDHIVVAAGASGALMGIAGAYVGHWIVRNSRGFEQEELTLTGPLAQTIGINLVLGFVNPGVDNACHIGGLFSGAVLGAAFALGEFEGNRFKTLVISAVISVASLGGLYLFLQKPPSADLVATGAQIREEQGGPAREEQRKRAQAQREQEIANDRANALPPVSKEAAAGEWVPLQDWASGMALGRNDQQLYVPNENDNTLKVVDLASKKVVTTVAGVKFRSHYGMCSAGRGCMSQGANGVTLTADERTAWVTSMAYDSVTQVDLGDGKVVGSIKAGGYPRAMVLAAGGQRGYVLNGADNTLVALDLANQKIVGVPAPFTAPGTEVGAVDRMLGMWLARGEKEVWIVDGNTPRLQVMDVASTPMKAVASIDLPSEYLRGWQANINLGKAWILSTTSIDVIDLASKKVSESLRFCRYVQSVVMAVSPDGTLVAVASNDDQYLSLIKLGTRKTIGVYPVKRNVDRLQFSADGKRLFALVLQSNGMNATEAGMAIIDTSRSASVIETMGTEGEMLCPVQEKQNE